MRVMCTLPNASTDIGGVRFQSIGGNMISEEISDEQGARFLSIDGFSECQDRTADEGMTKSVTPTSGLVRGHEQNDEEDLSVPEQKESSTTETLQGRKTGKKK